MARSGNRDAGPTRQQTEYRCSTVPTEKVAATSSHALAHGTATIGDES